MTRTVYAVVPGEIEDPAAPSGGNTYDRRACESLPDAGWSVRMLPVAGAWPHPDPSDRGRLAAALAGVPDDATVLMDGLVACPAPEVVRASTQRLRIAVLVHLPLADETGLSPQEAARREGAERQALHAAATVVTTSGWAARALVRRHSLPAIRVHVAVPGVDPAPAAPGSADGSRLLCVASVIPRKGQDLLVEALAELANRTWTCECVGAMDRDPAYAERVHRAVQAHQLVDRVRLVGTRTGEDLAASYAAADLVVLPSRAETYGMVATEALARGIPVVATDTGGVPEAIGRAPDGAVPGMLVPPEDPASLAAALRRWLDEPRARHRLRAAARGRRTLLPRWQDTARTLAGVLDELALRSVA